MSYRVHKVIKILFCFEISHAPNLRLFSFVIVCDFGVISTVYVSAAEAS